MRYRGMLSLAIAGLFILATAAVSQANWYQESEGSTGSTSEMTSPSPEPGTEAYEQQPESETGALPTGANVSVFHPEYPGDAGFQSLKNGGDRERAGIDVGP